jgi:transposase-like protein
LARIRLVSRSAVTEITERLWEEYEAFTRRDLSEFDIVYLFVDGIAERLRAGCPREPVIAAWGIGRNGQKVLLHLMSGSKEDTETVRAFFQDMRARGSAIRSWWPATVRRASSGRLRNASRARPGSAAWRTGCAISP